MNQPRQGKLVIVLGPIQVKHLRLAMQCLAKIGAELTWEVAREKVVCKSCNSAKSAMLEICMDRHFFDEFSLDGPTFECAVLIKHILASLRTAKIHQLTIDLDPEESSLTMTVNAENGLAKRYRLDCINAVGLTAPCDKERYHTHVTAATAELNKLLNSFQSTLSEISIIANPVQSVASMHKACQIQSFYDPQKGQDALHTSLAINTQSIFVGYTHSIASSSNVTFNLKDFRTMVCRDQLVGGYPTQVTFCEQMNLNMLVSFDDPGKPLVAEPHFHGQADLSIKATLIMATLEEAVPVIQMPQPPGPQVPNLFQQYAAQQHQYQHAGAHQDVHQGDQWNQGHKGNQGHQQLQDDQLPPWRSSDRLHNPPPERRHPSGMENADASPGPQQPSGNDKRQQIGGPRRLLPSDDGFPPKRPFGSGLATSFAGGRGEGAGFEDNDREDGPRDALITPFFQEDDMDPEQLPMRFHFFHSAHSSCFDGRSPALNRATAAARTPHTSVWASLINQHLGEGGQAAGEAGAGVGAAGGSPGHSRQQRHEEQWSHPAEQAIIRGDHVGYQRMKEDALQRNADDGSAISKDRTSLPAPWRPPLPGGAGPPLPLAEAAVAVTDLEEQQLCYDDGEWDEEEELPATQGESDADREVAEGVIPGMIG